MGLLVLLVILAVIFGGVGILIEGLAWLLIISLALLVAGVVFGMRGRSRA
jgi:energy-converting hydrogenase Eha subunit C